MAEPRFTVGSGRAAVRWHPPNWHVFDTERDLRVVATFRGGNGNAEQQARAHAAYLNDGLCDPKRRIV